jgi:hypothetical protein
MLKDEYKAQLFKRINKVWNDGNYIMRNFMNCTPPSVLSGYMYEEVMEG